MSSGGYVMIEGMHPQFRTFPDTAINNLPLEYLR